MTRQRPTAKMLQPRTRTRCFFFACFSFARQTQDLLFFFGDRNKRFPSATGARPSQLTQIREVGRWWSRATNQPWPRFARASVPTRLSKDASSADPRSPPARFTTSLVMVTSATSAIGCRESVMITSSLAIKFVVQVINAPVLSVRYIQLFFKKNPLVHR